MKTITAKAGQTVYDIALQELGSVEGVFDIMAANAFIRPDMSIPAGTSIFIPAAVINAAVVDYYTRNNISPVSGLGENITINVEDMINIQQTVTYDVSGGAASFEGVRLANLGGKLTVQINFTTIVGNVTAYIEQSLDGINYSAIADASGVIGTGTSSKTFNITGVVTNFVRVRLTAAGCTGTVDKIIWRV